MLNLAILTFLGLILGIVIASYTKDEIKTGKTYFVFAYKILIFALLILSLYFAWYAQISHMLLAFLAGMVVYFGISQLYFYMGILFVLSFWEKGNYFYMVAVLVFLIGLIRGALIKNKFSKMKNIQKRVVISFFAFAVPFALINFRTSVIGIENVIFAFVSGAIFIEFLKKITL
jgi:hypothetical protein|tara:strand:- start:11 stop:532 length:522 start_codon:yes stop_codon:yes gene_type:complete